MYMLITNITPIGCISINKSISKINIRRFFKLPFSSDDRLIRVWSKIILALIDLTYSGQQQFTNHEPIIFFKISHRQEILLTRFITPLS